MIRGAGRATSPVRAGTWRKDRARTDELATTPRAFESVIGFVERVAYHRGMKRATAHILVLISSLTFAGVWASAAPKDDRAATLELMRTVVPRSAYESMLTQMQAQMLAGMEQAGGQPVPADKRKALDAAVREVLPYDELISWSADVYTKHLSRKEIDDLAAFYATPTGKKVAALLPTISGEIGAKMGPLMMTRLPEVMKKHGLR